MTRVTVFAESDPPPEIGTRWVEFDVVRDVAEVARGGGPARVLLIGEMVGLADPLRVGGIDVVTASAASEVAALPDQAVGVAIGAGTVTAMPTVPLVKALARVLARNGRLTLVQTDPRRGIPSAPSNGLSIVAQADAPDALASEAQQLVDAMETDLIWDLRVSGLLPRSIRLWFQSVAVPAKRWVPAVAVTAINIRDPWCPPNTEPPAGGLAEGMLPPAETQTLAALGAHFSLERGLRAGSSAAVRAVAEQNSRPLLPQAVTDPTRRPRSRSR